MTFIPNRCDLRTLAAIVLLAGASAVAAPTSQPAQPTLDDYSILSTRNMFLRDRPRPRTYERHSSSTSRPADIDYTTPEAIERYTVLRGVVIEDSELHAYVENTHTGDVRRLVTGDTIGGGRVAEIDINAIAFQTNGRTNWIEVGQNLAGARIAPAASEPSATTMPTDTANLSVLERLKLRRMQEHKK